MEVGRGREKQVLSERPSVTMLLKYDINSNVTIGSLDLCFVHVVSPGPRVIADPAAPLTQRGLPLFPRSCAVPVVILTGVNGCPSGLG